jgi:hypothetical protein
MSCIDDFHTRIAVVIRAKSRVDLRFVQKWIMLRETTSGTTDQMCRSTWILVWLGQRPVVDCPVIDGPQSAKGNRWRASSCGKTWYCTPDSMRRTFDTLRICSEYLRVTTLLNTFRMNVREPRVPDLLHNRRTVSPVQKCECKVNPIGVGYHKMCSHLDWRSNSTSADDPWL